MFELTLEPHYGTVQSLRVSPEGEKRQGRVRHELPTGGVTSRLLRRVPLGEMQRALRVHLAQQPKDASEPLAEMMRDSVKHWSRFLDGGLGRPGRRGRPDEEYAALAAEYVGVLESGVSGAAKELAKRRRLDVSQVRNLLHEARRRRLLGEAPLGREGGQLTNKAKGLLSHGER